MNEAEAWLHKVLSGLLSFAVEVEFLREHGADNVPIEAIKTRHGFRYMPSKEDRDRIEAAAMGEARRWLERKRYRVVDVSVRNIGCDLIAEKHNESLWVEVKGTTLSDWAVEMTKNEYSAAMSRGKNYMLFIVILDGADTMTVKDTVPIRDPVRNKACSLEPLRYLVRQR